ncbi:hypothetical protein Tco_0109160 [Tanacetum coccineum]
MAGPKPSTPINERRSEEIPNQNATDKSVIERHLTALKELLKEPSNRELIKPMLLDFNDDAEDTYEEVEEESCAITSQPTPALKLNSTAKRADIRFLVIPLQEILADRKSVLLFDNLLPLGDQKKKTTMTDEKWMNVPITFPPIPSCDLSEEALVMEAEIEGYIVAIKQFTVILAPSPYNVILGRPRLKQLRAISSTIRGMMKFLTPWGVATLVSQAPVEGKFLGYMVTSEGIRANPSKTKDIVEMQSPQMWGQMQSLSKRLAALNRFLSRSAE